MANFPRFFTTITERWPAACRCLEQYEGLLTPIKKEHIGYTSQRVNVHWPTPSNLDDFADVGDTMNTSVSVDDLSTSAPYLILQDSRVPARFSDCPLPCRMIGTPHLALECRNILRDIMNPAVPIQHF